MPKRDRHAERRMEARIASLAHKHVKPEHVDGAITSIARSISHHVASLTDVQPDHLTNDMIDGYMRGHAGRHPDRAVAQPEPPKQLAHAQDALASPYLERK